MKFIVTTDVISNFVGGTLEALKLSWIHWFELEKAKKSNNSDNAPSGGSGTCACCELNDYMFIKFKISPSVACNKMCALNDEHCCGGFWHPSSKWENPGEVRVFIQDVYFQALIQEYGFTKGMIKIQKELRIKK